MANLNDLVKRDVRGEALHDGTGRVKVHWLQATPDGPIRRKAGVVMTNMGPVEIGGFTGRIACRPTLLSDEPVHNGVITRILVRSEDPRAVNCPECRATKAYWQAMLEMAVGTETPLSEEENRLATAAGVFPAPLAVGGV